jgi:phenylalanyl-tRNA synthetase beta chain
MRISLSYLRQFVQTETPAEKLGERFMMTSSEIEEVVDWQQRLAHCVVGKIIQISAHPKADRLRLAQVQVTPDPKQSVQIVCGASNITEQMIVAIALPGANLTTITGGSIAIATAEIRGQQSSGMICSTDELGIPLPSGDHEIWDLGTVLVNPRVGEDLAQALGLTQVLDLSITPNRPDLLAYRGLAREVATFEKKTLLDVSEASLTVRDTDASLVTSINPKAGRRLSALQVTLNGNTTTPWWVTAVLLQSGIRPISPLVDLTALVMLEYGLPLHAYDAEAIRGKKESNLAAVPLTKAAHFTGLDGKLRELILGDLVVVDGGQKILALAGIMGGFESAITAKTTRAIIEAAHFHGPLIRATSRRLGLRTDASHRFEKGLDPELTIQALHRIAWLIQETGIGSIEGGIIDSYVTPYIPVKPISVRFDHFKSVIGIRVQPHEIKVILEHLGFKITKMSKSGLLATPPSWRTDCTLPEDIYEEIIRIWGYERIPSQLITGAISAPQPNPSVVRDNRIREVLAAQGLLETLHVPFTSAQTMQKIRLSADAAIPLQNPISSDLSHLVPDHLAVLLPNLLEQNLSETELGIYELGTVFAVANGQYTEVKRLSLLLRTGQSDPTHRYRQAKQLIQSIAPKVSFSQAAEAPAYFAPQTVLEIQIGDSRIGYLGILDPEVVATYKIRRAKTIVYAYVIPDSIPENPAQLYQIPSMYPATTRDITIRLAEGTSVTWDTLCAALSGVPSTLRSQPVLLDRFINPATNETSLTIRWQFQSYDHTLQDQEITKELQRITDALRTLPLTINE